MMFKSEKKVTYKDIILFCWSYWKRRKKLGVFALSLILFSTLLDIFVPTLAGWIVDAFTLPVDVGKESVAKSMLSFAALVFVIVTTRFIGFQIYNIYECYSMRDILKEALRKVQNFSTVWHSNNFSGGTVRKITRARTSFEMFEDRLFLSLIPALIIMFGVTAMLYRELPSVGLFVLGLSITYCVLTIWISIKFLAPKYAVSSSADTYIGATLSDVITGNQTVKAFGGEETENKIFSNIAEDWRMKTTHAYRFAGGVDYIRDLGRLAMIAGMLALTYALWLKGDATPGNIALVITSYFMISGYLRDIGRQVADLQKAISEMEDVVWYWKTDVAVKDRPDAVQLEAKQGHVAFDSVTFSYGEQSPAIYDDFSIEIKAGEKVALVGHSGSGKSTFVKLLQRLYDLNRGEIRIDGQNIAGVTQGSLRESIALVPQDPILFHRTLFDNIAYGNQVASQEDVVEAAKKAYAHDFIKDLPHGYDTLVGERGIRLSGGERQRVALARAILSDAPILILDEATSALDSVSEHYIQLALKELMKGRTTITIAHRLSTIKDANRILVFHEGKIVEQGPHEQLLKNEGSHYKQLYDVQVLGFLGD